MALWVWHTVERSLATGAIFLYKAFWPILFGVLVTAILDVLVAPGKIARLLGRRDLKSMGIATAAGAASSACTFDLTRLCRDRDKDCHASARRATGDAGSAQTAITARFDGHRASVSQMIEALRAGGYDVEPPGR